MNLTNTDILERIKTGEDSYTEFKEQVGGRASLEAELCALLNFQGGLILLGVTDDGVLVGLEKPKETAQLIDDILQAGLNPPVNLAYRMILITDKTVCVIELPSHAYGKPFSTREGAFWIRQGSTKRKLGGQEIHRIRASAGIEQSADEQPLTAFDLAVVDSVALAAYFNQFYPHLPFASDGDKKESMRKTGLATDEALTLAGYVLFQSSYSPIRPDLNIKMLSYSGVDRASDIRARSVAEGRLESQYQQVLGFAVTHLDSISTRENFNAPQLEINRQALAEVIVNALVHREYGVLTPITFFIFSDRVEITSPGVLPNHLNEETARNGISVARNPVLFSHANRLRLSTGVGQGLHSLFLAHPKTQLINDANNRTFTVCIPRHSGATS